MNEHHMKHLFKVLKWENSICPDSDFCVDGCMDWTVRHSHEQLLLLSNRPDVPSGYTLIAKYKRRELEVPLGTAHSPNSPAVSTGIICTVTDYYLVEVFSEVF